MRSFIDKFIPNNFRLDLVLLMAPFILWVFCFRYFFTGHLWLQEDAVSYAFHINIYTDNLSKGIFPLWNQDWLSGVPYHFFLRRIGDVNPLLLFIVLFKWLGVPSTTAYLIFLGGYYFLAGWALYLITLSVLEGKFYAFVAYILFLFTSWGSEIFYNYIIIIFVPIIWFFYFLLCFYRKPNKGRFLGLCFCVGLVLTTYIPFFFLIILTIFTFLYVLFYRVESLNLAKASFHFFRKNVFFVSFCLVFLLVSCIPGLIFYKESKSAEFVLPDRHSGASSASEVAVGLNNVTSGDIISHGYFDRIFDDHANIDLGDIYVPYIFFLILLTTVFCRVNKLIFFLFFNILALLLITITSAAGVHRFLYEHIIFFKFIRNIYYFFWLGVLPMCILLSVTAFKSLITAVNASSKKTAWLVFIIACHLSFILFLLPHQGVLAGAWAAIVISMVYFWVLLRYDSKISYPAGFCLLLLAVFIQSAQVYSFLDKKLFQVQRDYTYIDKTQPKPKKKKLELYYVSRWLAILVDYIDPEVLNNYRSRLFMIYDNVYPYNDSPQFLKAFESSIASNSNIAYLSKFESSPDDWKSSPDSSPQADLDPVASKKLSVVFSDPNTFVLKAHLSKSQFLVINDNYNSDWHAFINGRPAHLFRANVAFKGLWVPSGESKILLRFSTPGRYLFHFSMLFLFTGTFLFLLVLLKKEKQAGPYV